MRIYFRWDTDKIRKFEKQRLALSNLIWKGRIVDGLTGDSRNVSTRIFMKMKVEKSLEGKREIKSKWCIKDFFIRWNKFLTKWNPKLQKYCDSRNVSADERSRRIEFCQTLLESGLHKRIKMSASPAIISGI